MRIFRSLFVGCALNMCLKWEGDLAEGDLPSPVNENDYEKSK